MSHNHDVSSNHVSSNDVQSNDVQSVSFDAGHSTTASANDSGPAMRASIPPTPTVQPPPPDATYEAWLRWEMQTDEYPPVSTARCDSIELTLVDAKSRDYLVRCMKSEFEVSAECDDDDWSQCLRTIRSWRILDPRLEAMRQLAQRRAPRGGIETPDCAGALATPTAANTPVFDIHCRNGYVQFEIVCQGDVVDDDCNVVTREARRLPYGLPNK